MWRGCCRIGPAGVALPKNMNDQRATRTLAQIADSASAAAQMALGRGCEKSLVHARVMLLATMGTEHAHGHACDLQQCSVVRFDTAPDRLARSRALECERAHFSLRSLVFWREGESQWVNFSLTGALAHMLGLFCAFAGAGRAAHGL